MSAFELTSYCFVTSHTSRAQEPTQNNSQMSQQANVQANQVPIVEANETNVQANPIMEANDFEVVTIDQNKVMAPNHDQQANIPTCLARMNAEWNDRSIRNDKHPITHVINDGIQEWKANGQFVFEQDGTHHIIQQLVCFVHYDPNASVLNRICVLSVLGIYNSNSAFLFSVYVRSDLRQQNRHVAVIESMTNYLHENRMVCSVPLQTCINKMIDNERYGNIFRGFGWFFERPKNKDDKAIITFGTQVRTRRSTAARSSNGAQSNAAAPAQNDTAAQANAAAPIQNDPAAQPIDQPAHDQVVDQNNNQGANWNNPNDPVDYGDHADIDEAPVAAPVPAAGSDAEAQDCPPAGEGGPKRKRKASGASRAAKKAANNAQSEEGGFTDKGRMEFKKEGGHLITGGKRTCLPDAIGMLLQTLSIVFEIEGIRSIMPSDPDQNTRFTAADAYVAQFGLTLRRVTNRFMQKGGVAFHLLNATGLFVIQLRITTGKDDKNPDLHCVAYDGKTVRDNYQYAKVKNLDATDRMPEHAHEVFDSLFHGLEVRIKNVYQLLPISEE